MTIQQWEAGFGSDKPKEVLFLGASGARMQRMVSQNLVCAPYRVIGDYDVAEDCACDDTAIDIYWGQLLAAADRLGHPVREFGLNVEGSNFEAAAARFILEKGEQQLRWFEDELPKELRR